MMVVLIDVDLLLAMLGLALYFMFLAVVISAVTVMFAHAIIIIEILSYSMRERRKEADILEGT